MKKFYKILLILVLISFLIRLYNLGLESLWGDEAISLYHSQKSLIGNLKWIAGDTNLPFYNIILWFWVRIFGFSEFAIRSLSIIFGSLSIFAIGVLAKKLFSKKVGIISAILLTFSSTHIYYSQEARAYSLFVLLTIGSFYYFSQYLKNKDTKKYIFINILLLYTHVFAVFIFIVQNIWYLIYYKKHKEWFKTQGKIILFLLPWIPFVIGQAAIIHKGFWIPAPLIRDLFLTFAQLSGGIISAIIVYSLIILNIKKNTKEKNLLYLWFLFPIIVTFVYSKIFMPLFVYRYFLFVLPALILLIALAIQNLSKTKTIVIIIILVSLSSISSFEHLNNSSKTNWQDTLSYIKNNTKQGDIFLIEPFYEIEPFKYYYSKKCFKEECDEIIGVKGDYNFENVSKQNVWLIRTVFFKHVDQNETIFKKLNNTKKLEKQNYFKNINIFYFTDITS